MRNAECGLKKDESRAALNPSSIPQSAIRIPHSEDLTKGARLSDATLLQNQLHKSEI
jgi:hypothetical protein